MFSLIADLLLFCCERDFLISLSDNKQADIIDTFNTTSRYLDTILNINKYFCDYMVSQIYPAELQLNKANTFDTEDSFFTCNIFDTEDSFLLAIVRNLWYSFHQNFR